MKNLYYFLKTGIWILGVFFMLHSSVLYPGSKDQFEQTENGDFTNFIFFRSLITLSIGIVVLGFSMLVNYLFRNVHLFSGKKALRIASAEIILVVLLTLLFTSIWVINR